MRDSDSSGVLLAVGHGASLEGRAVDKNIFKKKTQQPHWLSRKLAEGLILCTSWVSMSRKHPRTAITYLVPELSDTHIPVRGPRGLSEALSVSEHIWVPGQRAEDGGQELDLIFQWGITLNQNK